MTGVDRPAEHKSHNWFIYVNLLSLNITMKRKREYFVRDITCVPFTVGGGGDLFSQRCHSFIDWH